MILFDTPGKHKKSNGNFGVFMYYQMGTLAKNKLNFNHSNHNQTQEQPLEGFYKKILFLKILQNSQESIFAGVSFLLPQACSLFKIETLAQVFSSEFC